MEKSVVATRLLPVVELLLLEIVDADDLAEEIARTLGHDADGEAEGSRANGLCRRRPDFRLQLR
jgi:hypothetical protein